MVLHELELAYELEEVEKRNKTGINTLRCLGDFVKDLGFSSNEELIGYFDHSRVLDVGSGYNGLALVLGLSGVGASVVSINPTFRNPRFDWIQKDLLDRYRRLGLFGSYTSKELEEARTVANRNTMVAYAHNLPVESGSFDRVIDSSAVTMYFPRRLPLAYLKTVGEFIRVAAPGGRIRVASMADFGVPLSWKEEILRSVGLPFIYHPMGIELLKEQ